VDEISESDLPGQHRSKQQECKGSEASANRHVPASVIGWRRVLTCSCRAFNDAHVPLSELECVEYLSHQCILLWIRREGKGKGQRIGHARTDATSANAGRRGE
jgi:hypothetical protein